MWICFGEGFSRHPHGCQILLTPWTGDLILNQVPWVPTPGAKVAEVACLGGGCVALPKNIKKSDMFQDNVVFVTLGGGFQFFFPLVKMIHFDYCNIFQRGWNHQLMIVSYYDFSRIGEPTISF